MLRRALASVKLSVVLLRLSPPVPCVWRLRFLGGAPSLWLQMSNGFSDNP
jgi:hypothetical protein